jgi:hypothetical protein
MHGRCSATLFGKKEPFCTALDYIQVVAIHRTISLYDKAFFKIFVVVHRFLASTFRSFGPIRYFLETCRIGERGARVKTKYKGL